MGHDVTAQDAPYGPAFHQELQAGSLRSARVVVPLVLRAFQVRSVVDFGCGIGNWLRAFHENGVSDILGYDGDYIDTKDLQVDAAHFVPADLGRDIPLSRRFDLAMSVEVAEHLPPERAGGFVETLTAAAPAVLFGAAIPGQGGVHHINEQWQDFWRGLFASRGYRPVDLIRPEVWGRQDVESWYQQNTLLYCSEAFLAEHPALTPVATENSLNMVHPVLYEERRGMYLTKALKMLPGLGWQAVSRRLGLR